MVDFVHKCQLCDFYHIIGTYSVILKNILNAYPLDFSKHIKNRDVAKVGFI